jgi:hypothetical protein
MYTPRLLATANLRTPHVRAASSALRRPVVSVRKKRIGSSSGMVPAVDDAADVVAIAEGEEGVPVGDVEGFQGDPAGEERRDLGPAVRGDDDLVSEVDERAGSVGADHAEPASDEDHRMTS